MFHRPIYQNEQVQYFCGHSLGLQPTATKEYIELELRKWAQQGVEGHFEAPNPWLHYHTFLKPGLAQLCGAKESEVVAYGSLSANLHFLLASFYQPKGEKKKVLTEATSFPSDRFALETHVRSRGLNPKETIVWAPHDNRYCCDTERIISLIEENKDELAVIWLSGVNFLSGQVLDVATIVAAARKYDILVGLDLAHAIGNIPLQLHEWDLDFAVWCSYKYLNGGPGAVGGYFVHEKHFPSEHNQPTILAGWWGHHEDTRFGIGQDFAPIPNADAWQHSNANVLSLAAVRASLDIFQVSGIRDLATKSQPMTAKAFDLLENSPNCLLLTPKQARGNMISLQVKSKTKEIKAHLKSKNISVDWREPDVLRFSFCPLYNTEKEWEQFLFQLSEVL